MTNAPDSRGYVDHSATYTSGGVKNLPHVSRLRTILSTLEREGPFAGTSYADVGCSNGYVTSILSERLGVAEVTGFDHSERHLEEAREAHPSIEFSRIDLNRPPVPGGRRYELVTCFEVLEHVGRLDQALDNLLALTRPGGLLFISVPIEAGARGTLKFLAKTVVYRYNLDELPPLRHLFARYLGALATGRRMSRFRDERDGWGTHFGFDYRDVDDYLRAHRVDYRAFSRMTTRFYLVRCDEPTA